MSDKKTAAQLLQERRDAGLTAADIPATEPGVWHVLTPEEEAEIDALPCRMFHEEPFDFAYCEVHDTTFALGDVCKYQKANQSAEGIKP